MKFFIERQRYRHVGLGLVLDLYRHEFCLCLFRYNVVVGW